jgi:hypothetical protein
MAEQPAAAADKFTQCAGDELDTGADLAGKVDAGVKELPQAGDRAELEPTPSNPG